MATKPSSESAEFARPIVVVSRCLGFEACRFDAQMLRNSLVDSLGGLAEIHTVCPEVEIGLGTPRAPLRLVRGEDGVRLLQPSSGRDLSEELRDYNQRFMARHGELEGFILKNRSPSCGIRDAKLYPSAERGPALSRGPGAFAAAMLRAYPETAFEDEGRLSDPAIRHHFLTRIFTMAEYREKVRANPTRGALVRFHTRHKHLLLACDETRLRRMGKLVAQMEARPLDVLTEEYGSLLHAALTRGPRRGATINVLQHAYGYFSAQLSSGERSHFQQLLHGYRSSRLPLNAVLSALWSWVVRFDVEYIAGQSFYRPYPEALIEKLEAKSNSLSLVQP
jgi:uncharacterized protein YbgA (DUF1722 family)/uncharacterized protein YbbK (DUF523 family)